MHKIDLSLPLGVVVRGIPIADAHYDQLVDLEKVIADRYQLVRKQQFIAGRVLARSVLSELGISAGPIGQDEQGRPIVPDGVMLSLSHCQDYCVVAAIKGSASIGVDLECMGRVRPALWKKIFSINEQSTLLAQRDFAVLSTAFFAAKEAFYKYQFPYTGIRLGFLDIQVSPVHSSQESTAGIFEFKVSHACGVSIPEAKGRWAVVAGKFVFCCVAGK
jgi:4'-phosphopantetheinyl transferase EntD